MTRMDISKLTGLNIDTNKYKFEPIEKEQIEDVFIKLSEHIGLSNLRRVKGTNTFTSYVYLYNAFDLEETLNEYLSQ